jgi:hypothetical protein
MSLFDDVETRRLIPSYGFGKSAGDGVVGLGRAGRKGNEDSTAKLVSFYQST